MPKNQSDYIIICELPDAAASDPSKVSFPLGCRVCYNHVFEHESKHQVLIGASEGIVPAVSTVLMEKDPSKPMDKKMSYLYNVEVVDEHGTTTTAPLLEQNLAYASHCKVVLTKDDRQIDAEIAFSQILKGETTYQVPFREGGRFKVEKGVRPD